MVFQAESKDESTGIGAGPAHRRHSKEAAVSKGE